MKTNWQFISPLLIKIIFNYQNVFFCKKSWPNVVKSFFLFTRHHKLLTEPSAAPSVRFQSWTPSYYWTQTHKLGMRSRMHDKLFLKIWSSLFWYVLIRHLPGIGAVLCHEFQVLYAHCLVLQLGHRVIHAILPCCHVVLLAWWWGGQLVSEIVHVDSALQKNKVHQARLDFKS